MKKATLLLTTLLLLTLTGCSPEIRTVTIRPTIPTPPVCPQMLPVKFVPAGSLYGLEPSEARKLLANIEGMQGCISEFQLWSRKVERCLKK